MPTQARSELTLAAIVDTALDMAAGKPEPPQSLTDRLAALRAQLPAPR
jgi:hypothetical protein